MLRESRPLLRLRFLLQRGVLRRLLRGSVLQQLVLRGPMLLGRQLLLRLRLRPLLPVDVPQMLRYGMLRRKCKVLSQSRPVHSD